MIFPEIQIGTVVEEYYSIIYFTKRSETLHADSAIWTSLLATHEKNKMDSSRFPISNPRFDLLFTDSAGIHHIVTVREGEFISISPAGVLGEVCQILPSRSKESRFFKSREASESLAALSESLLPPKKNAGGKGQAPKVPRP